MTSSPTPPLRLVANLIAQIAFGLIAMTICLPSMPDWSARFHADQAAVQLTFSAYVIAYGGMGVFYGPLSDRHGRRRILLVGLAVAAAGSALGALATDLPTLIAARLLQGAGSGAGLVAGRASVQDLFQGPQRTRVMAYVGMVMGLCPPAATLIGGQLHERLGWHANFVLVLVLAVGLWLAAWRGLPSASPTVPPGSHWLRDMGAAYRRLLGEPAFVLNVAILAFTVAAFYAFLSGAPLVLHSQGVGPAQVGWYIMQVPLSYVVGNFAASRWAHRLGERRLMALGQGLTLGGITILLTLGLGGVRHPLAFSMPLMLLGMGHGLLMPACLARTVGLVPAMAGAAAAVAGLCQQLTGALGGYAVGWVSHQGPVNLGWLMLGFTLMAVAAQAVVNRR